MPDPNPGRLRACCRDVIRTVPVEVRYANLAEAPRRRQPDGLLPRSVFAAQQHAHTLVVTSCHDQVEIRIGVDECEGGVGDLRILQHHIALEQSTRAVVEQDVYSTGSHSDEVWKEIRVDVTDFQGAVLARNDRAIF